MDLNKTRWCLKQKDGIMIVEPNENLSKAYLAMAEESMKALSLLKDNTKLWEASTSYYSMYYCLYSLMIRIGIKCEIHSCSLEFLKVYLNELYNQEDIKMIIYAQDLRIDLQYYTSNKIDDDKFNKILDMFQFFTIIPRESYQS